METINDILKEMRERFKPYARSESNDARYTAYMGYAEFADRIEAAHKREIADALDTGAFVAEAKKQAVTDCNHLNEIMEEANGIAESVTSDYIEKKARRICDLSKRITLQGNGAKMREALEQINSIVWDKRRHTKEETEAHRLATEALSVPARNCDVGTPSERTDRYVAFCNSHAHCADCPCNKIDGDCEFSWGDMPYSEGDNNADEKQMLRGVEAVRKNARHPPLVFARRVSGAER